MISNWKQELVKRAGELFARGSKPAIRYGGPSNRPRKESGSRFASPPAPVEIGFILAHAAAAHEFEREP